MAESDATVIVSTYSTVLQTVRCSLTNQSKSVPERDKVVISTLVCIRNGSAPHKSRVTTQKLCACLISALSKLAVFSDCTVLKVSAGQVRSKWTCASARYNRSHTVVDYDAMKLLISQNVVVPVPACCALDIAQLDCLVSFSALEVPCGLPLLPSQFSCMRPSLFIASGGTLYCFQVERYT